MDKRILFASCLLGIVLLASCSQPESTDSEIELYGPDDDPVIEEPDNS